MGPEILLVHPPNILRATALKTSSISPHLCGYGLLHIGTYLKNLGYNVVCWNIPLAYKLGLDNRDLEGIFKTYDPLVTGIELNWLHLSKGALDLAKFLKNIHPNTPIIVGGVHATLFAKEIIKSYDAVDMVVKGEGERIMGELVEKVEKGQRLQGVAGTVSRVNSKVVETEGGKIFTDIDEVPPYIPNFLKPRQLNPYNIALINTCRGPCNFHCPHCVGARESYCLSPRTEIAFHSTDWIIKQIQILLDYVKELSIQDYIYCSPKRLVELTKALQREKLREEFDYFNLAVVPTQQIDQSILQSLAKAGIGNMDVGIESGSDYILQKLGRPYSRGQATQFLTTTVKNGIIPKTYWMITGLERGTDLEMNRSFLKETIELGAVPRWVTPLCALPGTHLFENADEYDLTLNFHSFQDYMNFSLQKFNRDAYYPKLITHSTPIMDVYEILEAVADLKTLILKSEEQIREILMKNEARFQQVQPHLYEQDLYRRIKTGIHYIRTTFF